MFIEALKGFCMNIPRFKKLEKKFKYSVRIPKVRSHKKRLKLDWNSLIFFKSLGKFENIQFTDACNLIKKVN